MRAVELSYYNIRPLKRKLQPAGRLTRTQRLCIPNSHAFFYVSRCHLVTEIHHELGKLLDIDNVLGIL